MPNLQYRLSWLLIVAAISPSLLGCSHDTPLAPDINGTDGGLHSPHSESDASSESHYLWGEWRITIDLETLCADTSPIRAARAHWDVTGFVAPPVCPSCLIIKDIKWVGQNLLSATVELTHPFPGKPNLDAFDVRGIVFGPPELDFPSGTVSRLVENPDGYCVRFSHDPWANINPYLDFAADHPERRFASGATHVREYVIRTPDDDPLVFDYAIDACWLHPDIVDPAAPTLSPHCNEAWKVESEISGPINGHPGAFAAIEAQIDDWQGDGNQAEVTIEAPALIPNAKALEMVHGGESPIFSCNITNQLEATPGVYPVLVCVRDALNNPSNDVLTNFQILEIPVTNTTPPLTGLSIDPSHGSLEVEGSQQFFKAVARFEDGGSAYVQNEIDWNVFGSDLNGNPLAEIDQLGVAVRLSSRWWGGTATVHADYQGFDAEAVLYCQDPFADDVEVEFGWNCEPGGTFTQPEKLLGPPLGGGSIGGGLHVCALGYGGVATLEFIDNIIVDEPGPDLIVFENAFYYGGCDWNGEWQDAVWNETALVEVSQDGLEWFRFPSDYGPHNETCGIDPWTNASSFSGIAGVHPVFAGVNSDGSLEGGIDPTDPATAGGDAFDLADVGLEWCRFVRLIDTGDSEDAPGTEQYDSNGDLILDLGKVSFGGGFGVAGFDGDSVAAVHSASPSTLE